MERTSNGAGACVFLQVLQMLGVFAYAMMHAHVYKVLPQISILRYMNRRSSG